MIRTKRCVMFSFLGLVLASAIPVAAQRASLERVEELVRMGRAGEARGVLLEWWDGRRDDASRRELQRGLWLRGRLTVDPVQAELDFQRLAVLYPRGSFTPQAIFRLAQAAHEMGDEEGARRHMATLVRDYANSPARDDAEAWLRGAGPAPLPPDAPTDVPGQADNAPSDAGAGLPADDPDPPPTGGGRSPG